MTIDIMEAYEAWGRKFDAYAKTIDNPMSEDQTVFFLRMHIVDKQFPNGLMPDDLAKQHIVTVATGRATWLELYISPQVLVFLCYMCVSPANITMMLSYIKWCTLRDKYEDKVRIDYLADLFPNGFPTNEALYQLWEAQKVDSTLFGNGNLLDLIAA